MTSRTPHDVLGVRPNASGAEIELAYKGRRTQYHPDKYQGSDAETLQWATEQMQQVNAAYAALSGSKEEELASRQQQQQQTAASSYRPNAASDEQPTLAEALQKFCSRYTTSSRAYFAPNIPTKKLNGALQSYGVGLHPSEVLLVIDTTVFGGAKEGMLVTEQGLRVKELASSCSSIKWQQVQQIEVNGSDFYINGRKFGDCTMADPDELVRLFFCIQDYLDRLRAIKEASPENANPTSQPVEKDGESSVTLRECTEMFSMAKAQLLDLCETIVPLEQRLGQDLIDRDDAVNYFGVLEECMRDPGGIHFAFVTLGEIAMLSQCAVSYQNDPKGEVPAVLLQDKDDDSRLVAELRVVLQTMVEARAGATQQARTSDFFKR
ncbi:MAG: J domain-containing protein [Polaromonas sp.]|uniref:J domain-containing protein n=1 Tax=Polaromonas sp. TaxID=1869339 RepID=UPI0024880143|nr:J domain-containing protein [Polaromonas sp.]MDI1269480.1 J domain-containing protein [Polaromonas sp.]